MSNNREFSQLASFINVLEGSDYIGIATDGTQVVGIGTTLIKLDGTTGEITATNFVGPSGSSLIDRIYLQEENSPVGSGFTTIRFIGDHITVTDAGSGSGIASVTVDISDYVGSISGTTNQIEIDSGTGSGSTPTISLSNNVSISTSLTVGTASTGVFAKNDGSLYVTGIATFTDNVILDSTNAIQIPAGTTEERGFRTLETEIGNVSAAGTDRITGINTSGIEVDQYVLGPSGVLRSDTQVTSVGIGSIGIGLTALAGVVHGTFKFGTISVVAGQIRYNSELSSFEGYGPGNAWGSLGGIKDVDADTYITAESSAGADEDTLTFYTAGTSRVVIDSNGKTGIGTNNPQAKFVVSSSGNNGLEFNPENDTGTNRILSYNRNSGQRTKLEFDASEIFVTNNTTEYLRLNSTGLGIGTNAPSTKLDVAGDISIRNGDQLNAIRTNSAGQLQFLRNDASNNQVTVTIDDENGNIGIGTDSPLAKLDVRDGSVYVPGGTFDASPLGDGSDSQSDAALVINKSSAIYFQDNGYLRNLIEPAGSVINIGQQNTSLISEINLKPGNASSNGVKLHHGGTSDNVKLQTLNYGVEVLGGLTVTDTNAIELPAGTTEERGFRLLETKTGNVSGVGTNTITGINTSGIEVNQYILGPSGVLRDNTQVNSIGVESIGIGLTALAASSGGTFRFGPIDFVAGQIRYNSESSSFEGYGPNNSWGPLSLAFSDGGGGGTNQSTGTLTIQGTGNEVEVDLTGSTYTVSLPDDVTIGQDLTVLRDLSVTGNITVGGTSGTLFTETLQVADADLILGVRTDANGNDISTDTTASHGGVALASTEGTPLVTLVNPGAGETLPSTYKKIMWFKKDSFTGLGTDAWLINYGVGIGSTQVPDGVRLAAGGVHIYENNVKANTFESTIATGTAPFTVASTTLVSNLNADKLDGQEGSYYLDTSATGQTKTGDLILNGNLGIGINDPAAKLDINPGYGTTYTGIFTGTDAYVPTTGEIRIGSDSVGAANTGDYVGLRFSIIGNGSGNANAGIFAVREQAEGNGKTSLAFATRNWGNGNNLTEKVRITSDGKVGIGITNPGAKLEVRDDNSTGIIVRANSTQSTDTNKALRVRNNSDTNTFHVSHKGQGYFAGSVGIGTDSPEEDLHIGSNSPYILLDDYDNSRKWKLKGTAWFAIEDTTAGEDRLRILSNGNIGIGTTTNPAEKLEVGGYVKATGFKASGTTGFLKSDGSIDNTAYGVGNLDAVLIKQNGSNVGDGQYTTLDFYGGAVAITSTTTVGVASVRIEESDTLDSVTARGNSTTNNLSVGVLTSTELKETYNSQDWNVVTQADVGYGSSQVPLNQYLGQLAFLDDYHPNGLRRDGGGYDDVFVNSSGNVGINTTLPTETLDVSGNIKAVDFNATSDENLKTNIRTIEDPLAKVVQIRGVNFDWKETQRPSLGVIAQEVEKVLPELVTDNGTKTVNYNGLIGLLIEAVKAQQEEIDILKSKIK